MRIWDVIYEIMLKMGISLDAAVRYIEINGKIVYCRRLPFD